MWALARFCAPWVPDAGEKEKNALPREREAFALRRFGARSRGRVSAKAFFSFTPGDCLRCKKRANAHAPRRAAILGFLIDVAPNLPRHQPFLRFCHRPSILPQSLTPTGLPRAGTHAE